MIRIDFLDECFLWLDNLIDFRVILRLRKCYCPWIMMFFIRIDWRRLISFGLFRCRGMKLIMLPWELVIGRLLMSLFFDSFSLFNVDTHLFKSLFFPTWHLIKWIVIDYLFGLILLVGFLLNYDRLFTLFVLVKDFLTADKACWKSGREGFWLILC